MHRHMLQQNRESNRGRKRQPPTREHVRDRALERKRRMRRASSCLPLIETGIFTLCSPIVYRTMLDTTSSASQEFASIPPPVLAPFPSAAVTQTETYTS